MMLAKPLACLALAAASMLASPALGEGATKFGVDSVHSVVVFRVGHMGVANMYGTIPAPSGSYAIDFANPSASTIDISIDADKIDSGNEKRDEHLRSPDFFNSKQFPKITFKATGFEKTGDKTMNVKGDLTMMGVTKPVDVKLEVLGEGETPQGYKNGFEATFSIKRSDFGMTKYLEKNAIGDDVKLVVAIEGKKQ